MRIPFIIQGPSIPSRTVTDQVRGVDLTPTLLDLAGVAPDGKADGESLAPLLRGQTRRDTPPSYGESWYPELHFGWSRLRSLRVGEWKYIDAPKPELYDLRQDKSESKNVITDRSNVAGAGAGVVGADGGRRGAAHRHHASGGP